MISTYDIMIRCGKNYEPSTVVATYDTYERACQMRDTFQDQVEKLILACALEVDPIPQYYVKPRLIFDR